MSPEPTRPEGQPNGVRVANLGLKIGDDRMQVQIPVPDRPVPLQGMLPALHVLSEAVETASVAAVRREGREVSCRAGCGACCRQLVPIAPTEARRLAELVAALPEPRRSEVLGRFAAAIERLEAAGLTGPLRDPEGISMPQWREFGLKYFGLGIACPFLVDESCSIHPDRPLSCREYLVTSPKENCSHPSAETIRPVPIPIQVSGVLGKVARDAGESASWVPLILAPEWAASHPDTTTDQPGPDWLIAVMKTLTGRNLPPPPATI